MINIENKKNNKIETNNKLDLESKKQAQEKIKKESKIKISELAEKILLIPIKKWLESLKLLVSPEKSKKEVKETLLTLDEEKSKEKTDALDWSKKTLNDLQKNIKIPHYYSDHAQKWLVEAAQAKSAGGLITKVSAWINDTNIVARWAAKGLDTMTRYT